MLRRWPWLFVSMLVLLGVTRSQGAGTIIGTVYAASGQDVSKAVVIACLVVNNDCDNAQSKAAAVNGNGSSGTYQIEGLSAASYLVIAWRDLNGSGNVDAGDEVGVYSQDGKTPALVKPPAQKVDLRLHAYDGNATSLFAAPDAAARPSGSGAAGEWSTVGIGPDVVSSANGGFVGSNNSAAGLRLDDKGNYTLSEYIYVTQLGGCSNWIITTTTGSYRLTAQQIMFTPSTSYERYQSGCIPATSYTRKNDPKDLQPFVRWWKVEANSEGEEVFSLSEGLGKPDTPPDWFYAWHLRRVKK